MSANVFTLCRRNGWPIVIACPMPDCGLSGATTTIFPRSFTASTRFMMPGAVIPSSFVISITGFFLLPPGFTFFVSLLIFLGVDFFFVTIFSGKNVSFFRHVQVLQSFAEETRDHACDL